MAKIIDKLKAIYRIIISKHFYLITADKKLYCEQTKSNTDDYTISGMIRLYWNLYWKRISNKY